MQLNKVVIAHSWNDVSLNIQTKAVAASLAENCKVFYITSARIMDTPLPSNKNLQVREWPNKRPNKLKDLWFIYRLLRKEKPEVAIVHFGATNILLMGAWLARVPNRIAWMHTLSGQYFLDLKSKRKARLSILIRTFVYKLATKVVVQNDFAKQDAISNYHIPATKLFKIYNGIKDLPFANTNNGNDLCIRYAGRLDHSKGIDLLINAFSQVVKKFPHARIELAGHGAEKEKYIEQVKELQLDKQIHFIGSLPYEKMYAFMSGSYCLAVPSRLDNMPAVVTEALATGTPVIASKCGGIPEMVTDGETGFLFENGNVHDLTSKLELLFGNIELRNKFAKAARAKFEQEFLVDIHVKNVTDFLKQL